MYVLYLTEQALDDLGAEKVALDAGKGAAFRKADRRHTCAKHPINQRIKTCLGGLNDGGIRGMLCRWHWC